MMSLNLKDYVRVYENFLEPSFCKKVIRKIKNKEWIDHEFHNETTKTGITYDTDLSVLNDDTLEETEFIHQKIWEAIYRYVAVDNKNLNNWFTHWNGYSRLRYNKYDKDTEMKLHCDHITTIFDGETRGIPTLSVLGALNEDYEGGELVMWENEVIELKTGSLMIFPSNFLYPHKVTPVKKGTRYSYVSWVW